MPLLGVEERFERLQIVGRRGLRPRSDRAAAKQLKDSDLDFVYTELPDQGHGFPESIRKDLFDFFAPRRLYEKKRKSAWPRCSLDGKPSKDEAHWLGDPLEVVSDT